MARACGFGADTNAPLPNQRAALITDRHEWLRIRTNHRSVIRVVSVTICENLSSVLRTEVRRFGIMFEPRYIFGAKTLDQ